MTKPLKKDNPTGINSNYKFSAVKHLDILKILMHLGHESETLEKPKTQAFSSFAYFSFAGFEVKGLLFVFFNVRTPGVDASFQGEPNKKNTWKS